MTWSKPYSICLRYEGEAAQFPQRMVYINGDKTRTRVEWAPGDTFDVTPTYLAKVPDRPLLPTFTLDKAKMWRDASAKMLADYDTYHPLGGQIRNGVLGGTLFGACVGTPTALNVGAILAAANGVGAGFVVPLVAANIAFSGVVGAACGAGTYFSEKKGHRAAAKRFETLYEVKALAELGDVALWMTKADSVDARAVQFGVGPFFNLYNDAMAIDAERYR